MSVESNIQIENTQQALSLAGTLSVALKELPTLSEKLGKHVKAMDCNAVYEIAYATELCSRLVTWMKDNVQTQRVNLQFYETALSQLQIANTHFQTLYNKNIPDECRYIQEIVRPEITATHIFRKRVWYEKQNAIEYDKYEDTRIADLRLARLTMPIMLGVLAAVIPKIDIAQWISKGLVNYQLAMNIPLESCYVLKSVSLLPIGIATAAVAMMTFGVWVYQAISERPRYPGFFRRGNELRRTKLIYLFEEMIITLEAHYKVTGYDIASFEAPVDMLRMASAEVDLDILTLQSQSKDCHKERSSI